MVLPSVDIAQIRVFDYKPPSNIAFGAFQISNPNVRAMAGFKAHITVSSVIGVGYGGAAFYMYGVPWPTAVLAGGLCSVSGMLPDIDSDSGTPLRESLAFAAAVVPMMLLPRLQQSGMAHELVILAGAAIYLLVRFGLGVLLKRYTVHRGMFHSIPAAIVFGEVAFLLTPGDDMRLRLYRAGAVVAGYLSHLILDEIYSVQWRGGRLRLKGSFGTALKLWGHSGWANVSAYAKLAILTAAIVCEPPMHQKSITPTGDSSIQQSATRVIDQILHR